MILKRLAAAIAPLLLGTSSLLCFVAIVLSPLGYAWCDSNGPSWMTEHVLAMYVTTVLVDLFLFVVGCALCAFTCACLEEDKSRTAAKGTGE